MEATQVDYGFFGSAVLWMLVTFPAYWFFQWKIEGEPFHLWRRGSPEAAEATGRLSRAISRKITRAGVEFSAPSPPAVATAEGSRSPAIR